MNKLTLVEKMSSLQIAELTGKRHADVLEAIRSLEGKGVDSCDITKSTYLDKNGQSRPCYELTKKAASLLNMNYKNKYICDFVGQHHIGTITRFEHSFGELLTTVLSRMGLSVIEQAKVSNYRIDFYIPEVNVAIEYDEIQHNSPTNIMKDFCRETSIKEAIGCKFIRVSYSETDADNLGIVLSKITKIKKVK